MTESGMVTEVADDCVGGCGCDFVVYEDIDGRRVEIHHVWPDDGAPHSETSECGCGPQRRVVSDVLVVYDHLDQDPAGL
jgi:hypothetical protein